MRSPGGGGGSSNVTGVPIKTRHTEKRRSCDDKAEMGRCGYTPGMPRTARNTGGSERSREQFFLGVLRRNCSADAFWLPAFSL